MYIVTDSDKLMELRSRLMNPNEYQNGTLQLQKVLRSIFFPPRNVLPRPGSDAGLFMSRT